MMTILGWILFISISAGIFFFIFSLSEEDRKSRIKAVLLSLILCGALFAGMRFYYTGTETGKRAMKAQQSELSGGLQRHVAVYDAIGHCLQEWTGRFDVDFDSEKQRILFDDENGLRRGVYFKSGTVIVEEVP